MRARANAADDSTLLIFLCLRPAVLFIYLYWTAAWLWLQSKGRIWLFLLHVPDWGSLSHCAVSVFSSVCLLLLLTVCVFVLGVCHVSCVKWKRWDLAQGKVERCRVTALLYAFMWTRLTYQLAFFCPWGRHLTFTGSTFFCGSHR